MWYWDVCLTGAQDQFNFSLKSHKHSFYRGVRKKQNAYYINISKWIGQRVPAEIVKTTKFCCRHKVRKPPSSPLCFGHTAANHPTTSHFGFTLIGDQRQTIIQAYTSPGNIAKASHTVQSHSTRPHTLTTVKVSKQLRPCLSENFSGHLLANSLRYTNCI